MARRYSLRLHFRRRDTGHCDPDRPEVLPLRLLPHWQPSSECPRVGLHLKWRDDTPFGYILDGAIRGIAILSFFVIDSRLCGVVSSSFFPRRVSAAYWC